MARYPTPTPPWATKTYGPSDTAWDDAKRQCRDVLIEWARAERYGTYTDLMNRVTAIPWPDRAYTHHGQQMGWLLGQVSLEELDRVADRPVLSALVIGAAEGMPSTGFWKFLEDDLKIAVPSDEKGRLEFWVREFRACCRVYGGRSPR
jgi:hypothetical protein